MLVVGRERMRETLADERDRLRRPLQGDAVFHSRGEIEAVGIGTSQRPGRIALKALRDAVEHTEREEQFRPEDRHRAREALWRDADDREGALVDTDRLAEKSRIESGSFPIGVGCDDNWQVLSRPALFAREPAPLK